MIYLFTFLTLICTNALQIGIFSLKYMFQCFWYGLGGMDWEGCGGMVGRVVEGRGVGVKRCVFKDNMYVVFFFSPFRNYTRNGRRLRIYARAQTGYWLYG